MELVAGIDSSTQSCKVVIADAVSGTVVREGRAAHPPGTEVDPEAWWQALQQAIAAAGGLGDVRAWAISGQQHGMVALDSRGRVVRPALLWNDLRSSDAATALIARYGATALAERTGLVPVPSFTLTKVHWLREHEPERARAVGAVALPHDWLTWRLRGFGPDSRLGADLDELVTDRSEASGTGYWTDAGYDRELFAEALGHDAVLPRVLAHDAAVRDADGRSVGPGSGDNAGAALGLGARVGDVVVSIGTSGTVFATSAHRTIDPSGTVAGFADAADGHLPLVATLSAARVLDTLAALLGVDHEELSRLALAASPGAGGLVLEPYLEGERTPNLPDATGTLFGMTLASTTRENVARSAYEGVLGGLLFGLNAIRDLGVPTERGILIGGGARSAAVRAMAHDDELGESDAERPDGEGDQSWRHDDSPDRLVGILADAAYCTSNVMIAHASIWRKQLTRRMAMGIGDDAVEVRAQGWRTLAALHGLIETALERSLGEAASLSVVEYTVLDALDRQDGWHMRMQQLARAAALSPSATTRLVNRLEDRGLLTRILCADDRRGIYTELTPAGRELYEQARPIHDAALERVLEDAAAQPELAPVVEALHGVALPALAAG